MAYMVDYISVQLVLTEWLEFAGLIFVHTLVIMTVPYTQLTGLGINISLGFLKAWFTMKVLAPNDRDDIIASGAGDDAIRLFVDSNNDCKKTSP
ncbi:hypothetical protein YC2023_037198 [Brassica napus]